MHYVRISWNHANPDDPVELFSELDEQSWEIRKVELFPDGHYGFASETESTESTDLGLEPVPPIEEIASDPEFIPGSISRLEFEEAWNSARRSVGVGQTS